MTSQRNQHFVPKVHLAPFTTNGDGKSISLFNIASGRIIHGAGIKHQCSGSYFYGEVKVLENLFGRIEGKYAQFVREIGAGELTTEAIGWLTMFIVLQYSRTLQAVESLKDFLEKASAVTIRGRTAKDSEPDLSHRALIHGSLRQFKWMLPYTRDLEFCVLRNRTKIDLVTSDNPHIYTNRFYLQKLKRDNFGMSSAGALIIMPIGPRFATCIYDPGMYKTDNGDGFVDIKNSNDISALNEMQYLNAHQNIYFRNPSDGEQIGAQFAIIGHRRLIEKNRLIEFAEVGKGRFRRIDGKIDETNLNSKMVLFQTPRPQIIRWPSILGFRLKRRAYSNGTSTGFVRNPAWLVGQRPV